VTSDQRLAQVATALELVEIPYVVMGGHAVRHYGVSRDTLDFDFHVSLSVSGDLADRLRRSRLFAGKPATELPGWRGEDFRRFLLGSLSDGREEFLEFWLRNHLLAPFDELYARREEGEVAGSRLPFLSLPDLIRSKETERESDWQDVALLEEILDLRNLARSGSESGARVALASLRSRRGYRLAETRSLLANPEHVAAALAQTHNPITQSFLAPSAAAASAATIAALPEFIASPLQQVTPGSARHLALVEAVRRLYRQQAVAADRADKERFKR